MLTKEWKNVEGFSNMGEGDDNIFARRVDNTVELAYMAFSGIKIVEMKNIEDINPCSESGFNLNDVQCFKGDDWEVAIATKVGEGVGLLTVGNCDEVSTQDLRVGNEPEIIASYEYDIDSYDEVDEDLLNKFGLSY